MIAMRPCQSPPTLSDMVRRDRQPAERHEAARRHPRGLHERSPAWSLTLQNNTCCGNSDENRLPAVSWRGRRSAFTSLTAATCPLPDSHTPGHVLSLMLSLYLSHLVIVPRATYQVFKCSSSLYRMLFICIYLLIIYVNELCCNRIQSTVCSVENSIFFLLLSQ